MIRLFKHFIKITKLCAKKTLFWLISWSKNFMKSFLKHIRCVWFYNIKKSNSRVLFILSSLLLPSFNRFFCSHSPNIVLECFCHFTNNAPQRTHDSHRSANWLVWWNQQPNTETICSRNSENKWNIDEYYIRNSENVNKNEKNNEKIIKIECKQ